MEQYRKEPNIQNQYKNGPKRLRAITVLRAIVEKITSCMKKKISLLGCTKNHFAFWVHQ